MASDTNLTAIRAAAPGDTGEKTVFKILLTISFCHLLNDTLQSLIPAIYPLLAAFVLTKGQSSLAWFSFLAFFGIVLLANIGAWTKHHKSYSPKSVTADPAPLAAMPPEHAHAALPTGKIALSLAILVALMFSKVFYLASLMSYYTFYLMAKFHGSIQSAQLHLFIFLGAVAAGTIIGGPVGDKFGRKYVIWASILGVLPFTLLLPYSNLFWTSVLTVIIGLILASAFSAILVYAQELLPGRIGAVSGLFFGFAFGMGGIGASLLGKLVDLTTLNFVYPLCSLLPAIAILTAFLPNLKPPKMHT